MTVTDIYDLLQLSCLFIIARHPEVVLINISEKFENNIRYPSQT